MLQRYCMLKVLYVVNIVGFMLYVYVYISLSKLRFEIQYFLEKVEKVLTKVL